MTALGILQFDGRLTAGAVHPRGRWIGGWNLDPLGHHIRATGDLNGDGSDEMVITSDWGIGILKSEGGSFSSAFQAPRDTMFGDWRYDDRSTPGRDRLMGTGNFTASDRKELLVWSGTGMTSLSLGESGLTPNSLHRNGHRLGGWVLSTLDNTYWGAGRFTRDRRQAMVLTSPWGIGIVSLHLGRHLFMAANGTRVGDWTVNTERQSLFLIGDFDGDGEDEILVRARTAVAVLKLVGGALTTLAFHRTGFAGGAIPEGPYDMAAVGRFGGGAAEQVLAIGNRGLHVLALEGGALVQRAYAANGTRVDDWVVDGFKNTVLPAGDLTGDGGEDFLIRSAWGIGVMSVQGSRFRCRDLQPYGVRLGGWPIAATDVIYAPGAYTGRGRREVLLKKPYPDRRTGPGFANTEFINWHGNVRQTVSTVRPRNLMALVDAVSAIQDRGQMVGVAGSGWSFTNCVVGPGTQALIDTSALNATLQGIVPDLVDDRANLTARYVHVEAGIKLHDLNCRLDALGLALPTLGGSRGQSLAGVMGTGVHGADVEFPPVADWVRAIHLVGPGGRQYWVESNRGPITRRETMNRILARGLLHPGTTVVYDNEWFDAVLVSMGCAGVIYAVVVEAVPAFRLRTTTVAESWSEAQSRIRNLSFPDRRPRFLEINVNPANSSCLTTTRDETADPVTPPAPPEGGPEIGHILAAAGLLGPGALGLFVAAIGDYVQRTSAEIAALGAIPFAGPFLQAQKTAEALQPVEDMHRLLVELGLAAVDHNNPRRVADVMPTAINLIWAIGAFVVSGRAIVDQVQNAITAMERPIGSRVGVSYQVMTGQPSCPSDGTQSHDETDRLVESFEYAVAANRAIAFVDRLIQVTTEQRRSNDAIVVNLNLRFTGRTSAILGMQKFECTCHVEIYTFRGMRGNPNFKRRLRTVVEEFDALPHWGQFHEPLEAAAFTRIGEVQRWQRVMRLIANGNEMFWSKFARDRGLLP